MNPHPHELAPLLLALGRAGIELGPQPAHHDRLRHRLAVLPPDLYGHGCGCTGRRSWACW